MAAGDGARAAPAASARRTKTRWRVVDSAAATAADFSAGCREIDSREAGKNRRRGVSAGGPGGGARGRSAKLPPGPTDSSPGWRTGRDLGEHGERHAATRPVVDDGQDHRQRDGLEPGEPTLGAAGARSRAPASRR